MTYARLWDYLNLAGGNILTSPFASSKFLLWELFLFISTTKPSICLQRQSFGLSMMRNHLSLCYPTKKIYTMEYPTVRHSNNYIAPVRKKSTVLATVALVRITYRVTLSTISRLDRKIFIRQTHT